MPYADEEMHKACQAVSYKRRYKAPTRKGKAFRRSESERKKEWQATPAGQQSNRERQRRYREKLKLKKRNAASAMKGNTETPRTSRRRDTGSKLSAATNGGNTRKRKT